jgi:hypothetical protein
VPHLAAILGNISCGRREQIITINPKFEIPYIHENEKRRKVLSLKDLGKRPPRYIVDVNASDIIVI